MPNSPEDGHLLPCRGEDCDKTFKTYGGRYNHERKKHNMHRKLEIYKKKEDTEKINEEEEKEIIEIEYDNEPLVPRKLDEDGFPTIDTDKESTVRDVFINGDGGPVFLMIKSIARVLTLVGDQDYLDALKPVEKDLKRACSRLTGKALAEMSPIQQVGLLIIIAWLPLILMDIPTFIDKWKNIKNKMGGKDEK